MQEILEFAVIVILISASGVMAPGPLFASCISHGLKGQHQMLRREKISL